MKKSTLMTSVIGILALSASGLVGVGTAFAVVVTRGPYLQQPTPSSVIVRWRTDVATDSRVEYGTSIGSLTNAVDDLGLTTEHEIQLSSLSADSQYYYSIGTTSGPLAGDDADHFFWTSPVVGTVKPIRIWVIGDSGFANADHEAVRDAYDTYNAGSKTDLWLLLGDNAYLLGTDANYQAALFDMHQAMLRNLAPWPAFGNHEAFSSDSLTETGPYFDMFSLPRAAEVGGVASGTEAYYSFDYANVHFIVLDSHFSDRSPGSPMLTWLDADLGAANADWVVVYWHHPPYSRGLFHNSDVELNEIEMRQNVLPILDDWGVDLVLCGHSHSYERSHLIDGHYGFSDTLTNEMVLDSGDGHPNGDGSYRKENTGLSPYEGAVYVVAGSSSQVRLATLDHPVMEIGLLELGSLVIDVNGNTLTATFLNSLVQTTDTFTIVKGAADCPDSPRVGCAESGKATVVLKDNQNDSRDKLVWRWRDGDLSAGNVANPLSQTDLAFCFYDGSGKLVEGAVSPGEDEPVDNLWKQIGNGGFLFRDKTASEAGIFKVKIKPAVGRQALILLKGKGAELSMPALPVTLPVTAQMANLDNGSCWQSTFTTAKKNDSKTVKARTP